MLLIEESIAYVLTYLLTHKPGLSETLHRSDNLKNCSALNFPKKKHEIVSKGFSSLAFKVGQIKKYTFMLLIDL